MAPIRFLLLLFLDLSRSLFKDQGENEVEGMKEERGGDERTDESRETGNSQVREANCASEFVAARKRRWDEEGG